MEQERINKNVNELSQKLLEGCKLLSDSCPETNVPLVSTMDGRMYSVGNGCYYVRDGGALVKISSSAMPPTSGSPVKVSPERSGSFITSATTAPPGGVVLSHESPRADADGQSLSARVAAKLLEGFTLLSEACPVTSVPLVQDPHGRILSVGTGKWYERTGGQLVETAGALSFAAAPAAPPAALPYQPGAYTPSAPHSASAAPASLPSRPALSYSSPYGAGAPPPPVAPPSPMPQGSSYGSSAVASALLATADAYAMGAPPMMPPTKLATTPAAPSSGFREPWRPGAAATGAPAASRVAVQEAIAVLSSRLGEATAALAGANLPEAAAPVALIKDIALAIGALRAL